MAIAELPVNSADVARAAPVVPVVRAALAVSEDPAEPAVRAALVVSEDPAVPVVRAALVVSESPAVPVALVVLVEAVLLRGHPRAQLAVVPRTKSVPAAHRPDLVPLLGAGEDLAAAAAETTLVPAAAEAVVAWEEADTVEAAAVEEDFTVAAVAVAAVAVAEEEAAAAGGDAEDKRTVDEEKQMKSKTNIMTSSKISLVASAILISCLLSLTVQAAPPAKTDAPGTSQPKQKAFDTPKQAIDSLVQAAETFDVAALKEILGPDSTDLVTSEDPVMDKNRAAAFVAKTKEKNSVNVDPKTPNQAIVSVGNDDFPLPIPIVKRKGKWYFDTKTGREEILNRRIGANELNAIQICRGFVEAQHEYAQEKRDDSKVNQYAQHILSTPGKHDGLAWKNQDGTWGGPVGEEAAKALEEGYSEKRGQPYHGYYFKVLKGQGPAAPMGEMDFVIGGAMIGGFALAGAPAEYRVTGVKTFIVGPDGIVYEKDLGPDTLKTFQSMDRYNPDKTWKVTEDDVEDDSQD
jgi:hypothetical protein